MGDHLVLFVDRLITESTLEAAIDSGKQVKFGSVDSELELAARKSIVDNRKGEGKIVECRICQDDDEESNMETPCFCSGSLKYAHRKCVQRWCNEKGDTMCEICLRQFKPDYTAPPKLFGYGRIPLSLRRNWEISRQDLQNHRLLAIVQNRSAHSDDYASTSTRSIMYCRIVSLLLMFLLLVRNILPFVTGEIEQCSIAVLILLLLRTSGIILPLYVMLRALTTFHDRRIQQVLLEESIMQTDEEENMEAQTLQQEQMV